MSAEAFLKKEVQRFLSNLTEVHCISTCSQEGTVFTWSVGVICLAQIVWCLVGVLLRWYHGRRQLLPLSFRQKLLAVMFSVTPSYPSVLDPSPVDPIPLDPIPVDSIPAVLSPSTSAPVGIGESFLIPIIVKTLFLV